MAKSPASTAVAKVGDNQMIIGGDVDLEELARDAAPIAGAGTSQDRSDTIIPFLAILQPLSPQLKRDSDKYIAEAVEGEIFRTDTQRRWPGEETGVIFQPCAFTKKWVEWKTRKSGGGFVQVHEQRPIDAKQKVIDGKIDPNKWWLPASGNDVVETRYHFGNLLDTENVDISAVVIGMTSTQHTVSRNWMSLMNSFKVPGTNLIAPSFFRAYRLRTVMKTNASGSWHVYKVDDIGWVSKNLRDVGKKLFDSIQSGERTAATPHEDGDVETGENSAGI